MLEVRFGLAAAGAFGVGVVEVFRGGGGRTNSRTFLAVRVGAAE